MSLMKRIMIAQDILMVHSVIASFELVYFLASYYSLATRIK